jgi:hypothetical protein
MTALTEALAVNRDAVARALPIAEQELARCRARCAQLELEIRHAKLVLTADPGTGDAAVGRQPLHEAMVLILQDHAAGLPAPEIARIVEQRDLYRRRDGGFAGLGQVHARVHNYPKLFVRDRGRIRLRRESDPPTE